MTNTNHNELIDIGTETTYSELEATEAAEVRIERRPPTLPLSAIRVADQVFQWRNAHSNLIASEDHTKELIRGALSRGESLDAVLVVAIGSSYYLVEGHHRIRAYKSAGWRDSIPVVYFEGSLSEARMEALKRNIKDKLPLTRDEKYEAAWTLVREGRLSAKAITEATTASRAVAVHVATTKSSSYPAAVR